MMCGETGAMAIAVLKDGSNGQIVGHKPEIYIAYSSCA
jgi:hypothetical protein